VKWTAADGTIWMWTGSGWRIISSAPTPRSPETPRKGGGYYPRGR
jgi:hypothetical protein